MKKLKILNWGIVVFQIVLLLISVCFKARPETIVIISANLIGCIVMAVFNTLDK